MARKTKLTGEEIKGIIELLKTDTMQIDIAKKFGVCQTTVCRIKKMLQSGEYGENFENIKYDELDYSSTKSKEKKEAEIKKQKFVEKVVCVSNNDGNVNHLVVGNVYDVTETDEKFYKIKNESGREQKYSKDLFEGYDESKEITDNKYYVTCKYDVAGFGIKTGEKYELVTVQPKTRFRDKCYIIVSGKKMHKVEAECFEEDIKAKGESEEINTEEKKREHSDIQLENCKFSEVPFLRESDQEKKLVKAYVCADGTEIKETEEKIDNAECKKTNFAEDHCLYSVKGGAKVETDNYKSLKTVFEKAVEQAEIGKGKERHANNEAFEEQKICKLNEFIGSCDGLIYQACKKAIESKRMSVERAIQELYGAMNYLAAAVIVLEKLEGGKNDNNN